MHSSHHILVNSILLSCLNFPDYTKCPDLSLTWGVKDGDCVTNEFYGANKN